MCSHSCKHAFVIRHTGNIRRDSTRGRQKDTESDRVSEREGREDMPLYEAVDFLKSQFAKFSISQYFQKLCPCAWVNSERDRERENGRGKETVERGEGCSPCRGACVRVCPLFGSSLCCAQVSSPCPIPQSRSTWNFTVFTVALQLSFSLFILRFLLSLLITFYCVSRIALSLEASVHNSLFYGEKYPKFFFLLNHKKIKKPTI